MSSKTKKQIKTIVAPPLPLKLTSPLDSRKRINLSDISCQCKKKKKTVKFNLPDKKGGKTKRRTKRYKKSRKRYKK